MRDKYAVSASVSEGSIAPVTHNEANAMRYVARYMCRHLRKKIETSNHPLKEEMLLCLMTMVKEKADTSSGPCEERTDLVDGGGGLWHVCENTYSFFLCLEEELHQLLPTLLHEENKKDNLIVTLSSNDDVLFY